MVKSACEATGQANVLLELTSTAELTDTVEATDTARVDITLAEMSAVRADVYHWLAGLLAQEQTEANLHDYFSEEGQAWLASLAATDELTVAVKQVQASLAALNLRQDSQLELAADFAEVFLGSHRASAPPYQSVYSGDKRLMMQHPHTEMLAWLSEYQLVQHATFNEPADHLAIQLALMAHLAMLSTQATEASQSRALIDAQQQFIQQHLLSWLPRFVLDVIRLDKFGFYAAVVQLILAYCELDRVYLTSEQQVS